jgi:enoyl-CoA hydratase
MGDTVLYEAADAVATLTLNRPERRNAITPQLVEDFGAALARALDDDEVRVVRLRGAGSAFCAGYDIGWGAESMHAAEAGAPWDPMADYRTMRRFVDAYMALWRSLKPVVAQVHGYCVAGGTDMALCSDLLVIAEDAKIGYPPARVWGSPTTAMWASRLGPMRAKRLLLTGDSLTGAEAAEWGLATEAAPAERLDERFERLLERVARMPVNQLVMMKLLVNQTVHAQGLTQTQVLGTFFDGIARHTEEGHAFVRRATEAGFREAVRERDEPYGDHGLEGFGLDP